MPEQRFDWYVIQVLSSQENKVRKGLEEYLEPKGMTDYIQEILVPTENVYEVKAGQQVVTQKRLWPGYILVKMHFTDESWSYVKYTNGVIGFLGGDRPTPLSDREVEEILDELRRKKEVVSQKHPYNVGDKVKITEGVFVNFMGTITDVQHDKGKLSVMVAIFGRETQVDDLEFWQVEEVAEEAS